MLWVARDRTGVELHHTKPVWHEENDAWNGKTYCCALPRDLFPELPIGECRELRMVESVDEASEREGFEREFGIVYPLEVNGLGDYVHNPTARVWQGWLAAKRDERGG